MSRPLVLSLPDDYDTGRILSLISEDAMPKGYRVRGRINAESDELFFERRVSPDVLDLGTEDTACAEDACRLAGSHLASALQILDNALTDYPEARAEVQAAADVVSPWR